MGIFGKYSDYYDILYKDKNYKKEIEFIDKIIKTHKPNAVSVLDLGCGTGLHANLLNKKGFELTGVDISKKMIEKAKKLNSSVKYYQSDIRNLNLNVKYDVIISLFHVISYLPSLKDFNKVIKRVKKHMNHDGLFIFDVWYGPAVIENPPSIRIRKVNKSGLSLKRISKPTHNKNKQIVNVDYSLYVKKDNLQEKLSERHTMRYFFKEEIEDILSLHKFEVIECGEWLSGKVPSKNTFGVYWLVKNIES